MAGRAMRIEPRKTVTTQPEISHSRSGIVDESAIAARAYELWQERGCPIGSDQEDWYRAEQELSAKRSTVTR